MISTHDDFQEGNINVRNYLLKLVVIDLFLSTAATEDLCETSLLEDELSVTSPLKAWAWDRLFEDRLLCCRDITEHLPREARPETNAKGERLIINLRSRLFKQ